MSVSNLKLKTRITLLAALIIGGVAIYRLASPEGIPLILEKKRQIHQLRVQKAELEREIRLLEEEVNKLREDPSTLEEELRRRWGLTKKGETVFNLPPDK